VLVRTKRASGAERVRAGGYGRERRTYRRFGIPLLFHVSSDNSKGGVLFLSSRDVSADGVFLLTDRAFPKNSKVSVRVMLPFSGDESVEESCFITLQGSVVRSHESGMAVRFSNVLPDKRRNRTRSDGEMVLMYHSPGGKIE